MRLILLTILCVFAIGCRTTDPRCRRETALLRSEILDLEDKYFLLKAERDALAQGQGLVQDVGAVEGTSHDGQIYSGTPIYSDGLIYPDGQIISDGPIYEGQVIGGQQILSDGQAYYLDSGQSAFDDSDIIYDEPYYSGNVSNGDVVINQAPYENEYGYLGNDDSASATTDDSILPLDTDEQSVYNNQLDGNSVMEDDRAPDPTDLDLSDGLSEYDQPELDSETANEELNLMLTAPRDSNKLEIGYDQTEQDELVTEVVINRLATQGHDVDGVPGDEGLDLLIQPKSAEGRIQLVGGELTVSVLDPAESPTRQRIGLWKFLASETELFFANNELGSYGILLHLPWDQQTPRNKRLMVHVKFVTQDGRELKTSSEIRIVPPSAHYSPSDPLVTGWTKRDRRWLPDLDSRMKSGSLSADSFSPPDRWRRDDLQPARNQSDRIQRDPVRRMIPARPAKTRINAPGWRPTR